MMMATGFEETNKGAARDLGEGSGIEQGDARRKARERLSLRASAARPNLASILASVATHTPITHSKA